MTSRPTDCFPARSAHQAKAKPSLRTGAGGVGGLVAVSVDGDYYFPGYDNNGNVIGYWNEDGEIVAEYAYDAFGNTIYEDGSMADFFPHRFSTKYYDAEADLYYYGYRYYSPSLGRWISRDPIEEEDCSNLFLFVDNNSMSWIDAFGQFAIYVHTDGFGHVGMYTKEGTSYDYGRYHHRYNPWSLLLLSRQAGPNVLVRNQNWSSMAKNHIYTVFTFSVCPEIDDMVSKAFKEKFDEGETSWPQSVLNRYKFGRKPGSLATNERYMGTDWSISDNCQTFTFNTIAKAAYSVNKQRSIAQKALLQTQELVRLATLSCLKVSPAGAETLLRQFAQKLDWITISTVSRPDAEGEAER